jgi:hypothetical protein
MFEQHRSKSCCYLQHLLKSTSPSAVNSSNCLSDVAQTLEITMQNIPRAIRTQNVASLVQNVTFVFFSFGGMYRQGNVFV